MSKGNKLVCKFFAVYALAVAVKEAWYYGVTWRFGADGWPNPIRGPGYNALMGLSHSKGLLQFMLLLLVGVSVYAVFKRKEN
jgi:hypothetical protein